MRATTSTLSLGISAALALFAASGASVAQERAIEQCRQISDETLRIACLEEALKEAYRTGSAARGEAASADPGPETGAAQAAASEQEEKQEGGTAPSNPFSSERESRAAANAAVEATNDLGSEQVEARQDRGGSGSGDEARLTAGVSAITTVPYRRLQITLDNGMIWRQIEGDVQRLRVDEDDVSTVEIWETRLGGYKLRLNELERTIRVERIR